MFDYGNVVDHFPTNTAFIGGRDGDLQVKIYNPAYNTRTSSPGTLTVCSGPSG